MTSENTKDRFLAEYWQLKIRCERLKEMLDEFETRLLKYDLSCRPSMLKRQLLCMQGYLNILEYRARIESIELDTFSEIHIQI